MDEQPRTDRDDGADGSRGRMGAVVMRVDERSYLKARIAELKQEKLALQKMLTDRDRQIAELEGDLEMAQEAIRKADPNFNAMQDRIAELERANENNLAGWMDDRAGLERRGLEVEAERDRYREALERIATAEEDWPASDTGFSKLQ